MQTDARRFFLNDVLHCGACGGTIGPGEEAIEVRDVGIRVYFHPQPCSDLALWNQG